MLGSTNERTFLSHRASSPCNRDISSNYFFNEYQEQIMLSYETLEPKGDEPSGKASFLLFGSRSKPSGEHTLQSFRIILEPGHFKKEYVPILSKFRMWLHVFFFGEVYALDDTPLFYKMKIGPQFSAIKLGLDQGFISPQKPVVRGFRVVVPSVYVGYFLSEPRIEGLKLYETIGGEVELVVGDILYKVKALEKPGDKLIENLPLLERIWQRILADSYVTVKTRQHSFADPSFYVREYHSYSIASFSSHAKNVLAFLEQVVSPAKICAPGDGVGLIKYHSPEAVSGDLVTGSLSAPGLLKESISETIVRGILSNCTHLYLGFVAAFLTESDWVNILEHDWQIYCVDVRSHIKPGMRELVEGLTVRGFFSKGVSSPLLPPSNKQSYYTENLLSHPKAFDFYSLGSAFNYMFSLNPLAKFWSSKKEIRQQMLDRGALVSSKPKVKVKLCESFKDFLDYGEFPFYFPPIGREVYQIPELVTRPSQIQNRTLYKTNQGWSISLRERFLSHYSRRESQPMLYFAEIHDSFNTFTLNSYGTLPLRVAPNLKFFPGYVVSVNGSQIHVSGFEELVLDASNSSTFERSLKSYARSTETVGLLRYLSSAGLIPYRWLRSE